ncbi:unnamed protein product [Sorangium cellulosum So ce56]|uniref:Sorangium cellulosum 'So ce 56' complete genome n=1 Tax=Sorangium cellulosum (strain So ce56) TaxID=448385 RepID=A9GQX0_SORC5|nr:hypothetical protein [Sorangium cellulosum]CAN90509.1 unnamed protein product [Sorangium cellulosum So ce56]
MNHERSPVDSPPAAALALAMGALATSALACSLIIEQRDVQCTSDADCAQFDGAICNRADSTCVPSSSGSAGGEGGDPPGGCAAADKPTVEITGDITEDFTLRCDKKYILKGQVNVSAGATLTIEKGTTVVGETNPQVPATLVVHPGSKLIAVGTRDEPIVFTSSKAPEDRMAGDWGGVILLGNAPTNHVDANGARTPGQIEGLTNNGRYGGIDENDSSGTLKYVRIEYSGVKLAPNNEINGLTLGGVGRGTIIDFVQVRHVSDDCFEFFGGTVNAKHLACQYSGDDAFDWDQGYRGKLQFLVAQLDPSVAEETNGFEGDNDPLALTPALEPRSEPTIYNATLCGKGVDVDKEQYGILLRRSTKANIANTIVTGFESGLDVRDPDPEQNISSSIFFNLVNDLAYAETSDGTGILQDDDGGFDEIAFLREPDRKNREEDPGIQGCFDPSAPVFGPATPLTKDAVVPPDGFFDTSAAFIGAFKDASDTWATSGKWAVWSPN